VGRRESTLQKPKSSFYTPLSLTSGAGRQYWDEVLRLLVNIRSDCDAAAERLGYASAKDDGLAAVEYIGNRILEAVRGERRQQIASANKPSAAKPPDVPRQSATAARHKSDKPARPPQPAGHSERSKLIGELKQMLRDGKTKAGAVIDPPLAHDIAKQITILNEGMVGPDTTDSIKQMRERIGPFLTKLSDRRKTPHRNRRTNPQRSLPLLWRRRNASGQRQACHAQTRQKKFAHIEERPEAMGERSADCAKNPKTRGPARDFLNANPRHLRRIGLAFALVMAATRRASGALCDQRATPSKLDNPIL
jgi:hypothetical protein